MSTRFPRTPAHATAATVLAAALSAGAQGQARRSDIVAEAAGAVAVRLICDSSSLVPGRVATLGVAFDIAPGWNLYWRNPGDSGDPIRVEFEAPAGITIGTALWPVPEREILPGDILDYTYRKRVILLFPVSLAERFAPGSGPAVITARVRWMVCREACVPGERLVVLTLPVSADASPSAERALIDESRSRLPAPPDSSVRVEWRGRTLVLSRPGADELTFLPYEGDPQPDDALRRGRSAGERLELTYGDAGTGDRVGGVLAVRRGGSIAYYEILSPPAPDQP